VGEGEGGLREWGQGRNGTEWSRDHYVEWRGGMDECG